jgi:zinc protease
VPGSFDTMYALGGAISDMLQFQLPDNYWETYAGKVERIRPAEIEEAARVLINPEKLVWVIVGDRSTIEQTLELPGVTNIHHIDADGRQV